MKAELEQIEFVVLGKAEPKQRPRVTMSGGHTYTPGKEKGSWYEAVQVYAISETNNVPSLNTPDARWTGPIAMVIYETRAMPKSWSKKKKATLDGTACESVPDGVNVVANVADALENIIYNNDRQIASWGYLKLWGEEDSTKIQVYRMKNHQGDPWTLTVAR